MAKIERSAKGKKKKRVAAGFAIAFALIFVLEGVFMGIIWGSRAAEKKKREPVVIAFGKPNEARNIAEEASSVAVQQYIYATLLNEKVARFDENGNPDEFAALVNEAAAAWEKADAYIDTLDSMGTRLEAEETKDGYLNVYKEGAVAWNPETGEPVIKDPFALYAHAWDKETVEWAQEIQDYYDRAPTGKHILLLSKVLKTDTQHAAAQFRQAQAILRGEAEVDEVNQTWHINNCKALVTTGKAAGTVAACITTGGIANVTVLGGGAITASGVDAYINYNATQASITLGDEHVITQKWDTAATYTGIVASVTSFWSLPGSQVYDKILFGAGTAGDLYEGKLLGGIVDVDADGEVKLFTFPVIEGSKSKAERKEAFKRSLKEFQEKYKGKEIFRNRLPIEGFDNLAETIALQEEAIQKGITNDPVPLSELPESNLNKLIEEYKNKVNSWYNEGMELMDWFLEQYNEAISNGSLYVIPEDAQYLYFPTVDDVAGAWDYNLSLSNVESDYVEAIIKGIASLIPVENAEEIVRENVTYNYNENGGFDVSGYMNIVPTGPNTANVTIYSQGDEGGWSASHYHGKMKNGLMTLKAYGTVRGGVAEAFPKLEFDFYGIDEGRYMSGNFYSDSFMITADVVYYGTRQSADSYWDMGGGY